MNKDNLEIEAHFLDIDIPSLQKKLETLGAKDLGKDFLHEMIFYDPEFKWREEKRFVRIRENKEKIMLAYKHFQYEEQREIPEVKEIELKVDSWEQTKLFLEHIGLVAFREQEKKRHSYHLDSVIIDIDQWPKIPPYVEIEGPSKEHIKEAAEKLGFEWEKAIFRGAGYIINHFYNIPVTNLRSFTFSKVE